jgi:hypothetical protein
MTTSVYGGHGPFPGALKILPELGEDVTIASIDAWLANART